MTSTKRILFVVFILIFLTGIAIGLIGRSICTRDNENYQKVKGYKSVFHKTPFDMLYQTEVN